MKKKKKKKGDLPLGGMDARLSSVRGGGKVA